MAKPKDLAQELLWRGIRHQRIRNEVLESPAWAALGWSSRALYLDLRAKLNKFNNGNVEATLACLKDRGWSSPATLSAALRELEGAGLIAKTRQGGIASLSKVCSLYRFTDLPVFEQKSKHHQISEMEVTFDYRKFQSVEEAKQAIAEFVGAQKQLNQRGTKAAVNIEEARKKRKLQIA
ncbi:hypothetical protein NKZ05_09180 [Stutzerimonas stutzeri]|uniref:hypothetical protein n=1 Tax=Stutzerimonas stutzeri TaxID=316 RepID=UPI0018D6B1AF|nr:hypothetical protein [Stutzerimonas stutzeri]MBH3353602.1 hypothetical protein [Stutzerimonas stutzeri]